MSAAILLCVSIVTLGQFCFYYWRAMVVNVSAHPISDRVRVAARVAAPTVGSHDFRAILSVRNLVPGLRGSGGCFQAIRAYYALVEKLGRVVPSIAQWCEAESACCSRYAAVLVDQQLQRNFARASEARGF